MKSRSWAISCCIEAISSSGSNQPNSSRLMASDCVTFASMSASDVVSTRCVAFCPMRINFGAARQTALRLWKAHEVSNADVGDVPGHSINDRVMSVRPTFRDGETEFGEYRGDACGEQRFHPAPTRGAAGLAAFPCSDARADGGIEVDQGGQVIAQRGLLRKANRG